MRNIFAKFCQNYNKKAWPLEDQSRRKRLTVIDQGQSCLQLLDRLKMALSSTSRVSRLFLSHCCSVAGSHSKNGTQDMNKNLFFGELLQGVRNYKKLCTRFGILSQKTKRGERKEHSHVHYTTIYSANYRIFKFTSELQDSKFLGF